MGIFRAKHSHWRKMKMAPLLWGPQPRPYLVTRVLKWNKSAIKKQALPIETLLMQQPERVVPARCDNGAPWSPFNCIFSQVFFCPLRPAGGARRARPQPSYSRAWTRKQEDCICPTPSFFFSFFCFATQTGIVINSNGHFASSPVPLSCRRPGPINVA